jgi:glycosyltransferase involved in cell wall biosynthesis
MPPVASRAAVESKGFVPKNQMKPAVAVIVPTYERLAFLREAVESVRAQTVADWEMVIADDGSTDGSADWVESLGDARIAVERRPHTGNKSALRNLGVARSTAEWIAFLDSDDRWHPEKLARQLAFHRANPTVRWSHTARRLVDAAGAPLPESLSRWEPHAGWILEHVVTLSANIALPSVMVDRALLRDAGGFDESFPWVEDFELWFRLAERAECGVVDEPLLDVRKHRRLTLQVPERSLGFSRIYGELATRTKDPRIRELARTRQAYKAVDAAGMLADQGRWSEAVRALAVAMRVRPLGPFVYRAAARLAAHRLRAIIARPTAHEA